MNLISTKKFFYKNFKKAFLSLEKSLTRDWRSDLKSPKAVFRETLKFKILDEEEVSKALEMLEFIPVLTKLLKQAGEN